MTPHRAKGNKEIEECRCYGANMQHGKKLCPIHRYTKKPKDCLHEKLSIDDMDKQGKRRCFGCGKYKVLWRGGEQKTMSSFQYVKPTDEQVTIMQSFRDKYEALAKELSALPKSRGLSLALTKLEESAFWLNKAITIND